MRINHGQVERRHIELLISQSDKHSTVDRGIALVRRGIGLERIRSVARDVQKRRVCGVELTHPQTVGGSAGGGVGYIAVIGANRLTGTVPFKEYLTAWVAERVGAIACDGGAAVLPDGGVDARLRRGDVGRVESVGIRPRGLVEGVGAIDASWIRLVQDTQRREILPHEPRLIRRARRNIRRQ